MVALDEELEAPFARILEQQAALRDEHAQCQALKSVRGSSLSLDDAASTPLEIGHFVSYCLMQAADLADSTRELVRRDDGSLELPIVGLYPVLRAQIESASMAAWVLAPEDRQTRVLRRLQAGHDELTYEKALIDSFLVGKSPEERNRVQRSNSQRLRAHRQQLRMVAASRDIPPVAYENSRPSWEAIVRTAGEELSFSNDRLVSMWRLASGFTHPSLRRGAIGLAQVSTTAMQGHTVRSVLAPRADWLLSLTAVAFNVTKLAIRNWRMAKETVITDGSSTSAAQRPGD